MFLTCGYSEELLDSMKGKVLFNATYDSERKQYVKEQPLTLTYWALIDKYKVHREP